MMTTSVPHLLRNGRFLMHDEQDEFDKMEKEEG